MILPDRDLASIQNARQLASAAHGAALEFADASQETVDRIVDAMARAAVTHSEELARLAVEETDMGRVDC